MKIKYRKLQRIKPYLVKMWNSKNCSNKCAAYLEPIFIPVLSLNFDSDIEKFVPCQRSLPVEPFLARKIEN